MINSEKYRIAIIEPSQLILGGFEKMIEESDKIVIDMASCEPPSEPNVDIEIVIINPNIIIQNKGLKLKELFPSAKIVAILYSHFDRDTMKHFDGVIEVNDNYFKIMQTLENLLKDKSSHSSSFETAEELSDREKEILVAIARGYTSKDVANEFHISIHTVTTHRKNISRKTGIRSVSGLLVYALLNNFIDESDVLI